MQPVRRCAGYILLCLVFVLGACSNQPARHSTEPGLSKAPRHPVVPGHVQPPDDRSSGDARQAVVAAARGMLGKPYLYGGTTRRGFDCSGLVWYSHQQAGIKVPRTARKQMWAVDPVSKRTMRSGDLLFFKIDGHRARHVGIYIGKGKFIHAPSSGQRVSTARLDNPYWRDRLIRSGNFY